MAKSKLAIPCCCSCKKRLKRSSPFNLCLKCIIKIAGGWGNTLKIPKNEAKAKIVDFYVSIYNRMPTEVIDILSKREWFKPVLARVQA